MITQILIAVKRTGVVFSLGIVALGLLLLLLPGCTILGGAESEGESYVGTVDDALFIGIAVNEEASGEGERALVAYLCDGEAVSQWFVAERVEQEMTLTAGDTRVDLAFSGGGVSGTVALAGQEPRAFEAAPTTGDAGLYRAEESFDDVDHVGGWIVLPDGRQQGAVSAGGSIVDSPRLDLETGEATTTGGTMEASPLWGGGGGSGKPSF
ncbi:MAG: hypothetical protein R3248_10750 [Candidatus Promineifilaceae bacterium]|nr:hypothetical protein [Candidatus Promineifilaceae bacterium]